MTRGDKGDTVSAYPMVYLLVCYAVGITLMTLVQYNEVLGAIGFALLVHSPFVTVAFVIILNQRIRRKTRSTRASTPKRVNPKWYIGLFGVPIIFTLLLIYLVQIGNMSANAAFEIAVFTILFQLAMNVVTILIQK